MKLFQKTRWVVVECLTAEFSKIEHLPFEIGSGDGVDLKLHGQGVAERHCAIKQLKKQGLCLVKEEANLPLVVDGESVELCPLVAEAECAVKIGSHLLVIRGGREIDTWLESLDFSQWTLYDEATKTMDGPMSLEELCQFAKEHQRHPQTVVRAQGLSKGFFLHDAFEVLAARQAAVAAAAESVAAAEAGEAPVDETQGPLTCPVCWLKFDLGDIMHVAAHNSLRGDPVLGEDAPQRFLATKFNDRGQALDALGLPCTETACPHCRRVLPPGFTESTHHIVSIVGDQSAGKSYYLSVLLKMLPASLYEHFSVVFQDTDPAGNAVVNAMKQALFGARTPEEARLVKTQLEGIMYERLPRHGRMVALPKPFVFSAAAAAEPGRRCSIIFYDNAGEHFQPGRDSEDSPGAQHVASSSAILFLFDPFNSPEFRGQMAGGKDPQLERPVLDQHAVLLSEMKVRIAKLRRLELKHRIEAPLAVLIGKCDAWMHLLGEQPFQNPISGGLLLQEILHANSARLREYVKRLCPAVVANAESLSREVLFFPVSSFGHAPVKIGSADYVPDPRRLQPFMVEVPVLWVLSRIAPDLVSSKPPNRSGL